jgi:tRNA 2-thiocytidine biosynthesis protein TtcA
MKQAAGLALQEGYVLAESDRESGAHPLFRDAPTSVAFGKLRKRLVREAREAMSTYGMVRPGARWLVCVSGGKDSYSLLAVLLDLQWRGLLDVDLLACNLDQAQPAFRRISCRSFSPGMACRTGSSGATPIRW